MMARCRCSNTLLLSLVLLLNTFSLQRLSAQQCRVGVLPMRDEKCVTTFIGIGSLGMQDDYLSPMTYNGPAFSLASQTRSMSDRNGNWLHSSFARIAYSPAGNGSGVGLTHSLDLNYRYSWEYLWLRRDGLTVTAGPEAFVKLGGLYNSRNSNNPATAKIYLAASVSGEVMYSFRVWDFPLAVSWRVEMPLIGYNFSPEYGLQYYEIAYLGKFADASHLAWPGNLTDFCQRLSLNIPVGKVQLTVCYYGDYFHYDIAGSACRIYDNSFMIGVARRLEFKYNGR